MPLTTLLWKQNIKRLMQECRKWYLRPYCIKQLVHVFMHLRRFLHLVCSYFGNYTKRIITFKKAAKCVYEPIFWYCIKKLKFAKNVTYDLIAFSRRFGLSYWGPLYEYRTWMSMVFEQTCHWSFYFHAHKVSILETSRFFFFFLTNVKSASLPFAQSFSHAKAQKRSDNLPQH